MDFEWDVEKERANRERHGISFDEAKELFTTGVNYLEIYDFEHSEDEAALSRLVWCVAD